MASAVGVLTAAGIYLMLRLRTFPVILGHDDALLRGQRVPLRLGAPRGRPAADHATGADAYTDPLPQALVLTAIVISFGMTAVT